MACVLIVLVQAWLTVSDWLIPRNACPDINQKLYVSSKGFRVGWWQPLFQLGQELECAVGA